MKTLNEYLDQAKKKTGSDYETAKRLKISRQRISQMRRREEISNEKAVELAALINCDPMKIIASAEVAKHPERIALWAKWIAATVIMSAGIATQDIDGNRHLTAFNFDRAIYYTHIGYLLVCALVLKLMASRMTLRCKFIDWINETIHYYFPSNCTGEFNIDRSSNCVQSLYN